MTDPDPLWYMLPLAPREEAAAEYDDLPVTVLHLSTHGERTLMRSQKYRWVGGLMRAGADIESLWQIGGTSLRQMDAALQPYFDAASTAINLREVAIADLPSLLQELRTRPALAYLTLDDDLAWPWTLRRPLAAHGIRRLGELAQTDGRVLYAEWAIERRLVAELVERLRNVLVLPDVVEPNDLARLWAAGGVTVAPAGFGEPDGMSLRDAVHTVLRDWAMAADETGALILQRRYGLLDVPKATLEELGAARGVTRERIRQLQKKALRRLFFRVSRLPSNTIGARLHPAVVRSLDTLNVLMAAVADQPMREAAFRRMGNEALAVDGPEPDPAAVLIAEMSGLERLRFAAPDLETVWHKLAKVDARRLARQIKCVQHHLTRGTAEPCTAAELVTAANRQLAKDEHLTNADMRLVLSLCAGVDGLPDGRFRGHRDGLGTWADVVVHFLTGAGEPMHITNLLPMLNEHLALQGSPPVQSEELRRRLYLDDRLAPIGRSGYWTLTSWEQVATESVVVLIERCLIEHDRPMTAAEIHQWIVAQRPVGDTTVHTYLHLDDRFARTSAHEFVLVAWNADGPRYPLLPRRQHSPRPAGDRPRPRMNTVSQRLADHARTILADAPEHTLRLRELCTLLMAEFDKPSPSVYVALQQAPDIETFQSPDHTGKWVRLRLPTAVP